MNRRPVRIVLALLVVITASVAGYRLFQLQQETATQRTSDRAFDTLAAGLVAKLTDLRAAQQAYVAAGQGDTFWSATVDATIESIRADMDALKRTAMGDGTMSALETTGGLIDDFVQMDKRARSQASAGQLLMASDVIFTDGMEMTRTAATHVEAARRTEQQARDRTGEHNLAQQRYLGAGVLVLSTLVVMLLMPLPAQSRRQPTTILARERPEELKTARADTPADRAAAAADTKRPEPTVQAAAPPAASVSATQDAATALTLKSTADLCTDFGRVSDPAELPGLLERAARLLDASGIIVWIATAPGAELRPMLAHGYGPQALSRMRALGPDDENATVAAYRNARMETVRTNGASNGAIVAPLISNMGCVGVMTAEVRHGAECKASLQALASILAAQLAALVAPAPMAAAAEPREELSRTS